MLSRCPYFTLRHDGQPLGLSLAMRFFFDTAHAEFVDFHGRTEETQSL